MTERRNFRLYMAATASWFFHFGVQLVLFTWLVAIELHESADRVGLAQTAMMLPSLLLILIGGVAADRFGGRPVASLAHLIAGAAPLVLAVIVASGGLSYTILILYALWIGVCQAFIAPARDGMLTQVSGPDIQRAVMFVTGAQFGMQLIGFAVAAAADVSGPVPLMVIQSLAILAGALCYFRLRFERPPERPAAGELGSQMVLDGIRHVLRSEILRASMILTFSVGMLFMGVFMVGIPLLLRDLHGATPADLAFVNVCNMFGVILTIALLLKRGGIRRRGRAYLIALFLGGLIVALMGVAMPYWAVLCVVFLWGLVGGVAMSMGRTIAQEAAAPAFRSRVMSIYALTLFGGAPLGAAAMGYLIEFLGVLNAMFIPAAGMVAVTLAVRWKTRLWRL